MRPEFKPRNHASTTHDAGTYSCFIIGFIFISVADISRQSLRKHGKAGLAVPISGVQSFEITAMSSIYIYIKRATHARDSL